MTDDAKASLRALHISKRIRAVRELSGLTSEEAADLVWIDRTSWAAYESGDEIPRAEDLFDFCARFRLSLDYIFWGHLIGVRRETARLLMEKIPDFVEYPNLPDAVGNVEPAA
jgi:DNA-binding XRE family transcriptional regulator